MNRSLESRKVYHQFVSLKGEHMQNANAFKNTGVVAPNSKSHTDRDLHPAWSAFIKYCFELEHGEIEILKIQDGLPVLAEVTRKKIKFAL